MAISMSKSDAVLWLIQHLEPELKMGGCHLYKSNFKGYSEYGCSVCKDRLDTLEQVKKILKVSQKDTMKWNATDRITE